MEIGAQGTQTPRWGGFAEACPAPGTRNQARDWEAEICTRGAEAVCMGKGQSLRTSKEAGSRGINKTVTPNRRRARMTWNEDGPEQECSGPGGKQAATCAAGRGVARRRVKGGLGGMTPGDGASSDGVFHLTALYKNMEGETTKNNEYPITTRSGKDPGRIDQLSGAGAPGPRESSRRMRTPAFCSKARMPVSPARCAAPTSTRVSPPRCR